MGIGYSIAANNAAERVRIAQFDVDAASNNRTDACVSPTGALAEYCGELGSAVDDESQARNLANVGWVAGGIGALGALGALFLWPEEVGNENVSVRAGGAGGSLHVSIQANF